MEEYKIKSALYIGIMESYMHIDILYKKVQEIVKEFIILVIAFIIRFLYTECMLFQYGTDPSLPLLSIKEKQKTILYISLLKLNKQILGHEPKDCRLFPKQNKHSTDRG